MLYRTLLQNINILQNIASAVQNTAAIKNIQWRIITIIKNLPERQKYKTVRTPKELASSLDMKILESKHDIQRVADRLRCRQCMENFKVSDSSLIHWLSSSCIHMPSSNRPVPIMNNMLHIGNQIIHFSHSLSVHRGLVYCNKCGSRKAADVLKKLAHPCEPPSTYGKATLKAILSDKLPPNLLAWPAMQG